MSPWTTHLWRLLLRAYPSEFRYEYGLEMIEALAGRCHEEHGFSRAWFCIQAVIDVVFTACRERYRMIIRDLTYSCRRFAAHPGVAAVAILSLALGIGANTTMFSVIYASLLRPLPYPEVHRRVVVFTTALNSSNKRNWNGATSADFSIGARRARNLWIGTCSLAAPRLRLGARACRS